MEKVTWTDQKGEASQKLASKINRSKKSKSQGKITFERRYSTE